MNIIPTEYAGKCIALVNDKVIAVEKNSLQAYQKAKILYPKKMITLMCVPKKNQVVTFL